MPSGAAAESVRRLAARFAGAVDPKRITPPAPAATSAVTAATTVSSTGTTRVCSARAVRLQVSRTVAFVHTGAVAVGSGVGVVAGSVAVGRGDVGAVPGSEQAVRSEVAAAIARSPGVVRPTTVYTGRAAIIGCAELSRWASPGMRNEVSGR